ncbi:MAG: hypothetical protein AAGU11_07805 [Syntrophobacteraceae bacterium]
MTKRGIFIGIGAVCLVFGLTGIAVLQTDLLRDLAGTDSRERLEAPAPEPSGIPDQPGAEGTGPAASGKTGSGGTLPPAPGQAASPPAEPSQSAPRTAGTPSPAAQRPDSPSVPDTTPPPSARQAPEDLPPEQPEITAKPIPPAKKGERRLPEPKKLSEPPKPGRKSSVAKAGKATPPGTRPGSHTAGKRPPAERQPVVVRVDFDPSRKNDIHVARVHLGDRVEIKVRRVGRADRQLYLKFDLPERELVQRERYRGRELRRTSAMITRIRDNDRLILKGSDEFGDELLRRLDSRDGAVLKLGAVSLEREGMRSRESLREKGRYQVEIRIYSGNRLNIKPRSLS